MDSSGAGSEATVLMWVDDDVEEDESEDDNVEAEVED